MHLPRLENRWWRRLPTILACYPLGWLALAYLFAARAWWVLGRWPSADRPDPSDLGFTLHQGAILLGLVALPMFALATVVLAVGGRRFGMDRRLGPTLTLLVVSIGLLIGLTQIDPGGVFGWFAD